jgi:hypothetical protein
MAEMSEKFREMGGGGVCGEGVIEAAGEVRLCRTRLRETLDSTLRVTDYLSWDGTRYRPLETLAELTLWLTTSAAHPERDFAARP